MADYPTDEELDKIRTWEIQSEADAKSLFSYVMELWHWPNFTTYNESEGMYYLATGGWSGNESLIAAMYDNLVIHSLCWHSSYRGGRHVFTLEHVHNL